MKYYFMTEFLIFLYRFEACLLRQNTCNLAMSIIDEQDCCRQIMRPPASGFQLMYKVPAFC